MGLSKHAVEEAGGFLLFGWLRVVPGKRVVAFVLCHGAIDIYKVGALVRVVSMQNGLGRLIGEARGGVG